MAKLIINPQTPSRKEIDLPPSGLSIGRDPSNDVVIPDALVSRRHARITFDAGQYLFQDCESANGSLLNGARVSERRLADGDVLWLGASRLLFRAPEVSTDGSLAKVIQHPSSHRMRCPACQESYASGDVFCRHCGVTLEAEASGMRCATCHARITGPARFCASCGESLGGAPRSDRSMSLRVPAPLIPQPAPPAGKPGRPELQAAPLDRRILAITVDAVAAGCLFALFGTAPLAAWLQFESFPLAAALTVLPLAAVPCYFIGFWALRRATPGLELLGLEIAMQDPWARFGVREAFIRFAALCVSLATLGLGFLMILVDGDALHDGLAGTRVIERRS